MMRTEARSIGCFLRIADWPCTTDGNRSEPLRGCPATTRSATLSRHRREDGPNDKVHELVKGYLLTGPQALTAREQVATIAEVTGRPIEFQDVTPYEFAQAAIQQGTPPEQAHLMERLNEVFRARRWVNITDDVENITGVAPGTFRGWCQRHADAFR